MEDNLAKMLALILMQKLPKRSNVYDLSRIFEWKFQYFDYKNIIKELEKDGLISINSGIVNEYILEEKGEKFIKNNFDDFKNKILISFPAEIEFLTVLLK